MNVSSMFKAVSYLKRKRAKDVYLKTSNDAQGNAEKMSIDTYVDGKRYQMEVTPGSVKVTTTKVEWL